MSDQPVTEAATYKAQNKHNRQTSMLSTGFEHPISGFKRLHGYQDRIRYVLNSMNLLVLKIAVICE
jgi:hypothetical protein